ncbi:hypothetical protein CBF23_002740 [Marinomonas agarivorans]|nr:hypothetical protein CBF23_002740 [Marinomonas agarivorans]
MNRLFIRLTERINQGTSPTEAASLEHDDSLESASQDIPLKESALKESALKKSALKKSVLQESTSFQNQVSLENQLSWLLWSNEGKRLGSGANISSQDLRHYLADKGFDYDDVVFFPPEHRIQTRQLVLTKGQHRHIDKIAPYLLEEFFAQPPEELHLTLLNKGKQSVWVSAVAKTHMDAWLSALHLMGWQSPTILPVASLLPFWPEQEDDTALLFVAPTEGYLLKDEGCVTYVPQELAPQLPKRERYQVCSAQEQFDALPLTGEKLALTQWSTHNPDESALVALAKVIDNSKPALAGNLCHGAYQQKTSKKNNHSAWWWVAALFCFCVGAEIFLTIKNTSALNQQAEQITTISREEFLKLVPDEGRVFHLQRQIQSRIQRAKQGQSQNNAVNIYEIMATIDQVRNQLNQQVNGGHRIIRFDFASNTVRLDWQAQERETLDQLRTSLQKSSLNALMEQVAKRGEGYVASIKITIGG